MKENRKEKGIEKKEKKDREIAINSSGKKVRFFLSGRAQLQINNSGTNP